MDAMQLVVFGLNEETCGIDTSQINSILRYENIINISDMPEFIEGIVEVRGAYVPIVNLNRRFSLGNTGISDKAKIITVQIGDRLIGLAVNDVFEICTLSPENIETAPELIHRAGNACINRVGKKEEKLIMIIEPKAVLTEHELAKLDAYIKDLEARKNEAENI